MLLLKLLIVLAFSFTQVIGQMTGVETIPPGLSWYTCSEVRTDFIDFRIQTIDPATILSKQSQEIGAFGKGAISTNTYINSDTGIVDTFVIRKRYLEQYFNSNTINDVNYYPDFSCNNIANTVCSRHSTNQKLLPDYDFQCLIVANSNPGNVTITYELDFSPSQDGSDAMKLSDGKIGQILLIGLIISLTNFIIM
ncbi:hypothetical protein C1645_780206 [Glomus cerebriforme]|uniref:Uncharacterized protein n=1 Tax=Glomus cerebriforme TaxID=658196 RepID=A0A397SJG5_9GLOM|nr:hypothetical protein C1645_780206 [Glomus cerebriforme]